MTLVVAIVTWVALRHKTPAGCYLAGGLVFALAWFVPAVAADATLIVEGNGARSVLEDRVGLLEVQLQELPYGSLLARAPSLNGSAWPPECPPDTNPDKMSRQAAELLSVLRFPGLRETTSGSVAVPQRHEAEALVTQLTCIPRSSADVVARTWFTAGVARAEEYRLLSDRGTSRPELRKRARRAFGYALTALTAWADEPEEVFSRLANGVTVPDSSRRLFLDVANAAMRTSKLEIRPPSATWWLNGEPRRGALEVVSGPHWIRVGEETALVTVEGSMVLELPSFLPGTLRAAVVESASADLASFASPPTLAASNSDAWLLEGDVWVRLRSPSVVGPLVASTGATTGLALLMEGVVTAAVRGAELQDEPVQEVYNDIRRAQTGALVRAGVGAGLVTAAAVTWIDHRRAVRRRQRARELLADD